MPTPASRRRSRWAGTLVLAAALAGCTSGSDGGAGPSTSSGRRVLSLAPPTSPASNPNASTSEDGGSGTSGPTSPTPAGSKAQRVLDAMSERQRVGQLLMVDCPSTGVSSATSSAITRYRVGSVILDGTSTAGVSGTAGITAQLRDLAPARAGLFVATDQEGGVVQRLQGSGFSDIPSAAGQGELPPATLRADATTWGSELRRAGVNLDLAPVLDTVPANSGPNPPIGDLDRQYGSTPAVVRSHGLAYLHGMAAAGVDAVAKHFPGLGRVTTNTDTTAGVTDRVTTRDDAYLEPFRAAVRAGIPFVMVSSAIYARIDPSRPAVFSPTIITGMLRGDLGFRGVVISDDIGAAAQVSGYPVGQRAVDFVQAGGDVVLTVVASQAGPMTAALLDKARSDPAFKKQVDAAALRVLQAKQARGLL